MTIEDIRRANLRALIHEAGSQVKAAVLLGVEPSYISQIAGQNPTRNVGSTMARRIESSWGKPKGWLDESHIQANEPTPAYNVQIGPEIVRSVPLISWVQAGAWGNLVDELEPGQAYKRIPTTVHVGARAYALRVVGDSMTNPSGSPSFPEGTILILDPDRQAESGNYVVVRQNGDTECTFKQLVRDGGALYLKPLNPRYPILQMHRDAVVCGVLAQAVMDF
jgi:SOS-response transcriptional repressor LexA